MTAEQRFEQLGEKLPVIPPSKGIYKPCLVVGNLLYVSGHVPISADGSRVAGKVGVDLDTETAKSVARLVGLCILSTLRTHLGSLDKIRRVVKVLGMVNAVDNYEEHPLVINGCSELFAQVWGEESGIGVRSAVGMGSLPNRVPVEIEAVFELA